MRRSSMQGFTLLEMLVAVGLLALLGLASALALNSALRSKSIIGDNQFALEQLQRSQRILSRDLEQLLLRQGRDSSGSPLTPQLTAHPQPDQSNAGLILQFFKSGRRLIDPSSASSRLEQVRYRIEDQQLLRETTTLLDPSSSTPWHSSVLLADVSRIELRFFHQQQWLEQWPPLNQATPPAAADTQLPAAIELRWQTARYSNLSQLILIPGGR